GRGSAADVSRPAPVTPIRSRQATAGRDSAAAGTRPIRGPAVRRATGAGPARLAGAAPGRLAGGADHPGAAAMTAGTAREVPAPAAPGREARLAWPPRAGMRLLRLHAASRRVPVAIAAIAACAV